MYLYTVYCDGEVVDIATEKEVAELMQIFRGSGVSVNYETMVVEIYD